MTTQKETAERFLQRGGDKNIIFKEFNVFETASFCSKPIPYNRRDFYKIALVKCKANLYYADRGITIDRPALLFANPLIPYAFEPETKEQGYFCLFTEEFFKSNDRNESLQDSPLYKIGADPVFFLDEEQELVIKSFFRKMIDEIDRDYIHKYDLLRNYVNLIIHEALKMQPNTHYFKHQNATGRIADLFMALLERQFPIDSPQATVKLKTANDFATHLSVHVNHLNSSVRQVTGKTTTEVITARIINEAKALLLHTDWNVSEIAYSLGFEYPAYFTNLFKKQTGATPLSLRK
ncbi:MAG TPA: helix-turn-helix transcriptional regulator [Mucilaginibacter sp.]|jgi:AraC-like DNA-binding protein